jgi:AcrR family transcriptional regulator
MQRPNEQKRRTIVDVATRLFGTRPFHEVRLEDIAAKAKIGKGTIYIYFRSKEDLYESIVREAFSALLKCVEHKLAEQKLAPPDALRLVVREQVEFAANRRWIYQLLRHVQAKPGASKNVAQRIELGNLISDIIRQGNRSGDFSDPHPELTAHFIPATVRASIVYGPEDLSSDVLAEQVYRIVVGGLMAGSANPRAKRRGRRPGLKK